MSEAAIQVAILTRLRAFSGLTDLLAAGAASITDYKPQSGTPEDDGPFPYVTIGDDEHLPWDTDTSDGLESDLRIHVWSRIRSRMPVKLIQAQVKAALQHHDLFIGGGAVSVLLYFDGSNVTPDPDGKTHHGIQTFRLLTDEAD